MTDWVDEAIKELVKETADYTKLESFFMWCNHIAPRVHQSGSTVFEEVEQRMKQIHKLRYLDTMQKVQLLFVFGQPISFFYKMQLHRQGHKVEQDKSHRIMRFCSKDGWYKRSIEDRTEHFKGKPIQGSQDAQGQSPCQVPQNNGASRAGDSAANATVPVEPLSSSGADYVWEPIAFDDPISQATVAAQAHGSSAHEQKPIVFGGPGTPNFPVFVYDTIKEEPMVDFKNEQNSWGAHSSAQEFVEEWNQVTVEYPMTSGSEDLILEEVQTKRPGPARTHARQEIILNPQQRRMAEKRIAESYMNGVTEQQRRSIEARFARPIQSEVHDEPSTHRTPSASQSTNSSKRCQEASVTMNTKRSKPSCEHSKNSGSMSSSEDDDIIEVPQSVSFTTASSTRPSEAQQASHISALNLAERIETIAHFLNLHDLQTKTARIVRELELEDKTICPKKFHREILSIWASIDDAKVKNHEGESLNVKKFLESLRLCVIRPLGRKMVADSLMYIEKKIKRLEEKKSRKVLPMGKIEENLESLLELAVDS